MDLEDGEMYIIISVMIFARQLATVLQGW